TGPRASTSTPRGTGGGSLAATTSTRASWACRASAAQARTGRTANTSAGLNQRPDMEASGGRQEGRTAGALGEPGPGRQWPDRARGRLVMKEAEAVKPKNTLASGGCEPPSPTTPRGSHPPLAKVTAIGKMGRGGADESLVSGLWQERAAARAGGT